MAGKLTIANLNALITANATQFLSEMQKVGAESHKTANIITRAFSGIAEGLSIAGILEFSKTIIEFGRHITDLSTVANMDGQAFQTLSGLAAESGVQMEQVAKASENMRSKLQEAAREGAGPMNNALKDIGLNARMLQELAPEKQWVEFAKALHNATDKQAALNTMSEYFGGKIGPKLKEVLESLATQDWDKISKGMASIRLDKDQLKSLDEAGDKLERMWTYIKVISAKGFLTATKHTAGGWLDTLAVGMAVQASVGLKSAKDFLTNPVAEVVRKSPSAVPDLQTNGLPPGVDEATWAAAMAAEKEMKERKADVPTTADQQDIYSRARADGQKIAEDRYNDKIRAMKEIPITQMFSDSLSRIGLLTGPAGSESKKQTNLLQNMLNELKLANFNLRKASGTAAAATFQ